MIEEHTKQDHTVCVLEGIKERREFMTSVAGLKRRVLRGLLPCCMLLVPLCDCVCAWGWLHSTDELERP